MSLRCADGVAGSGFFITPTRLVTNAYSRCESQAVEVVLANGQRLVGQTVEVDWRLDLALVSVPDAQAEPLELGDAASVRRGDAVYVFGRPDYVAGNLAQTRISNEEYPFHGIPYLQIDSMVNPDNTGGPLLDERGLVVGIVTTTAGDAPNLRLALPVNSLITRHDGWAQQTVTSVDDETWARRLRGAEAEDRAEVNKLVASTWAPLESAVVRNGSTLELLMLRSGQQRPPDGNGRMNFTITHEVGPVCRTWGTGSWQPIAEIGLPWLDPSTSAWLASHNPDHPLWAAVYRIRLEGCPPAYQLAGLEIYPAGDVFGVRIELEKSMR